MGFNSTTVSIPGYISANLGIGVSPSYPLDVAGSVRLGSAASDTVRLNTITPMYTTPSFTAGMIGFKISGTISASSITAGSETKISTINLPIGVWIVNGAVQTNSSQTGEGTFYYITDDPTYSFIQMGGLARNTSQYYYNAISVTVYITAAKDLNMYYSPSTTTLLGGYTYFFAVRIA